MMIDYLIIILILIGSYKVLTINNKLNNLETNLLYKHIKTQNHLELFYQKLIQSNNIYDLKLLKNTINENDIRNLNIQNKVNIE
jgi:hypothetical protein